MKQTGHEMRVRMCVSLSALLMLVLVCAVCCLPAAQEQTVGAAAPVPETYRADRDTLREQEKAQLRQILDDPQTGESMRAQAQQRLMETMEWASEEAAIEEMLCLRGFEEALVNVYRDSANVLVRSDGLSREQAAVIFDLVAQQTGLAGGSIKIIPYE